MRTLAQTNVRKNKILKHRQTVFQYMRQIANKTFLSLVTCCQAEPEPQGFLRLGRMACDTCCGVEICICIYFTITVQNEKLRCSLQPHAPFL
jgi:hypothetical protein